MILSPVTFPLGRARLATSPLATGSPAATMTIGIVRVTCLAAVGPGVPALTMTSTLSRTRSAARWVSRSSLPSAHRYSMARFRPSTQPRSRSPCRKAWRRCGAVEAVADPRSPTRYTFAALCSCASTAASGGGLGGGRGAGFPPPVERQVVGEELERDDREDGGEQLVHRRERDRLRRERGEGPGVLPRPRHEGGPHVLRGAG